jgi:aminopeptidase N
MLKQALKSFLIVALGVSALALHIAGQQIAPDRPRVYDVQNYVIRISFDASKKIVYGDTTIELTPLDQPLSAVELDSVGINYNSVRLASDNKDLVYRSGNGTITVTLDRVYRPNEEISIRFRYTVTSPAKGVYFIPESPASDRFRHPAQVWTQNEPEDARYWFPSFDHPSDKAMSEEFITAPKGEIAIGNGELVDKRANADGTTVFHYRMRVPHATYLTSFVVGDFVPLADKHRGIPLTFYAYRDQRSVATAAFARTKDIMSAYESLTGVDYPFSKYDQVMVAGFSEFDGMENITATNLADTKILFAAFPFSKMLVEDLVSHELAHSWFGNLVTCRNWSELWLNEGFATFMEAASRETLYGRDSYLSKLKQDREEFFVDDAISKRRHALQNRLAQPDNSLFDATTYQKGGLVLHMLRETVGDAAFWKAVRLYLVRHKFGSVVSSDLQSAMEEASGQKLQWFFDQWVYAAGFPKLEIKQAYDKASSEVRLTVDQVQRDDGITPAAFRFPLEVEVPTAAGPVARTLDISKRSETFVVKVPAEPNGLVVDKAEKIILKSVKLL